jgi:hypothetical protein
LRVGIRRATFVSGEILFVDGPGGSASRLVGALQTLAGEVPPTEFALIGGLAVMTRLGRVHRATDDLDAAAQSIDGGPSRLSVLVGGGESGRARRPVDGVKVDCIDVGSTPAADLDPEALPEDQFDRAFILAHRWALDSATPASLTVVSGERGPPGHRDVPCGHPGGPRGHEAPIGPTSAYRAGAQRAQRLWGSVRPAHRTGVVARDRYRPAEGTPWARPLVSATDRARIRDGRPPDRPRHTTDRAT